MPAIVAVVATANDADTVAATSSDLAFDAVAVAD